MNFVEEIKVVPVFRITAGDLLLKTLPYKISPDLINLVDAKVVSLTGHVNHNRVAFADNSLLNKRNADLDRFAEK